VTQTAAKPQPSIPEQLVRVEESWRGVSDGARLEALFPKAFSLWSQRTFLWKAAIAGLLAGTLVAFLLPKRYESTTQLMPPDNQSGAGLAMLAGMEAGPGRTTGGGGLAAIASELLGEKNTGALFIGILHSRTVQSRLVGRFDLRHEYGKRLEEDACHKLEQNTQISEDRKSGIIAITVTDHDAKRAAAIAKAYAEELDRLVAELSTSSARRERIFLEGRLSAVKQDLDRASKEFSQFASKNTTIDIQEEGRTMLESAAVLQGQLIAAESELRGLEEIYTKNNVRVRSLQGRVDELKRQLEMLGGKNETAETTGSSENGDAIYPSIRKLPLLGVTYADLYRNTRIEEIVFESLTQEYELAKVQEAKEIPSVRVLDAPDMPERRSFPPRSAIMFLGLVCGIVAGIAWILGRTRWTELNPDDPTKMLGLHVFHAVKARVNWELTNGSREGGVLGDLPSPSNDKKSL
jgi:uncharacterized protein involved in exopolysaccharide biosynthesis